MSPDDAHLAPSPSVLLSYIEFLQGNYALSVKELNRDKTSVLKGINLYRTPNLTFADNVGAVMYFNSLGCIHLLMDKYTLASFYFNKALTFNNNHSGICSRPNTR